MNRPDHDDITQFVDVSTAVGDESPAGDTTVFWNEPDPTDQTKAYDPVHQVPLPRELPIEWQQSRRPSRWPKVLLGTLVVAAAIVAAVVVGIRSNRPSADRTGGIATDTPNAKYPPQRDLTLDACSVQGDGLHMSGTVGNPTQKVATYQIDAVMVDENGSLVTQGSTTVANVAPNTRIGWQAVLPPHEAVGTAATCKVVKVNRSPA